MKKLSILLGLLLVFSIPSVVMSQSLGDTYDIGITANAINPWSPGKVLSEHEGELETVGDYRGFTIGTGYEVGIATWFIDMVGLDITFAYRGKKDNSTSTIRGSGTISYQEIDGTTTTSHYHNDGTDKEKDITDARMSFTFMPKYKALKYKQSYLFIGIPISFAQGYNRDISAVTTNLGVWNNNGTIASSSDVDDDWNDQITTTTNTRKLEYGTWIGYGIAIGGSFQFESIQGLELTFMIGFIYGGERKTTMKNSEKVVNEAYANETEWDAKTPNATTVTINNNYDRLDGDYSKDSSGSGTFGGGAIVTLGVSYYFM